MTPARRRWYAACGLVLCAVLATSRPAGSDADHITVSILAEVDLNSSMGSGPPRTAYENDVRRIARVFDELELPLPERITVRLYRSSDLLTRGLEEDGGLTSSLSQSELADGHGCGPQWLAEGMADWVAFTVLDRLGVARMTAETDSLFTLQRHDLATTPLALDLDRIDEPRRFLEHARDVGAHALYRFAFRLVHHLVERHGFDAVAGYFRARQSQTAIGVLP